MATPLFSRGSFHVFWDGGIIEHCAKAHCPRPEHQMPIQSALIAAIQSCSVIEFRDGGGYLRIGEPHLLGVCAETETMQLEMFQTDGDKARAGAHLPQWRRFVISEIWALRTTAVKFLPRNGFESASPRWSRTIAAVPK